MTKAGSHFSLEQSEITSEQRPECSKREKNSAYLRGKVSSRRTGENLEAGNKFVIFEEQQGQIGEARSQRAVVTTLYVISLQRLLPSTLRYRPDYSILLTALPIHSCSPPIHNPHCSKTTNNLYKTQINVAPLQKALQRFHAVWLL